MALTRFSSTVLSSGATSAGGSLTTAEKDLGNNTKVAALHVFTTITTTGLGATPEGNDSIVVSLIPRAATTGANATPGAAWSARHPVSSRGPYVFHDVFRDVPRFVLVRVQNATKVASVTAGITVAVECIKET